MNEINQRIEESAAVLLQRIGQFVEGRELTNTTIWAVQGIIDSHIATSRMNGLPFPDVVMIILPTPRWIQIVQRDLGPDDIMQLCRNFISQFPDLSANEIAFAIRKAFPHYVAKELAHLLRVH